MEDKPHVVMVGSLGAGYSAVGPFSSYRDAETFVEQHVYPGYFYIMEILPPRVYEKVRG